MSQSDNKKTNTAKNTFMFLLIFTIICLGITVALIYNTISLKKQEMLSEQPVNVIEKEVTPVKKSTVEKVELTDKYYTNGITSEEKRISLGDIVYQYETAVQRKLEIRYVQISGLKDTVIQDKINKDIENHVLSLRDDKELNSSDIERIGIYASISANFSDVLSIIISKDVHKNVNSEDKFEYEYIGLNYSLKDGEKINFSDLFTEDASIKNIITQSIYDSLAWNYAQESGNMDADMNEIDYSSIENKVFKILAKYNQNPNFNFYFSTYTISIIDEEIIYTIRMEDVYESIAIYTRYKSNKNLYEDESLANDYNYVFSTINSFSDFVVDSNNKTDNFQYRIMRNYVIENASDDVKNAESAVKDILYKKINEYALLANTNKEKGYIFDVMYYVSEYNEKVGYTYWGYLCSMDKKFYNEKLEAIKATAMREDFIELTPFDYSWYDKDNIVFEEEISLYNEDYTNPIETEQIITREDRERIYAENGY